jgi:DUF1680 family protein
MYSASADAVWIHLYAQGTATVDLDASRSLKLRMETRYPWHGDIALTVEESNGPKNFGLNLRVPDWCPNATLQINGEPAVYQNENGYCFITRDWKAGDTVLFRLPMTAQRIEAHPAVAENRGCVALQRGPLVYCVEACDHEKDLSEITLPANATLQEQWRDDVLGGVMTITAEACGLSFLDEWQGKLYRPATGTSGESVRLTAIPYFAWANREAGAMRVWIPQRAC